MSKDFIISRTAFPKADRAAEEEREREARMLAGVDEAIAQLDAGLGIPGEEIEAWVESWDTDNELPPPQPRRRS